MIKKINSLFFLFTFLFLINLFSPDKILAVDTTIDCGITPGTCLVTGLDPLFSDTDGFWFPGRILSKTFNLKNSSDSTQTMSLQANRSPLSVIIPSLLEDNNILNISIIDSSPSLLWSGDLNNFYSTGQIDLGIFPPSTDLDFIISVSMNNAADNDYQGKQAIFDLTLGFTTDTPPPAIGGDNGNGNGTNGPSSPSAPVCSDLLPFAPTNLAATSLSPSQVLLSWDTISPPFTSFLLAFGPAIGDYRWGNPNIGTSTSYTVTSLAPGAQYCFYVRAQNGCMPGPISNQVCINTGSLIPISEIPPLGFEPGVLGEQTESELPLSPSGQISGLQTICLRHWLPILFLLAFFINLLHYSRRPSHRRHLFPLLTSLLAFAIDRYFLQNRCCLITFLYCDYFWIGNILSFLIPAYHYRRQSK